MVYAKKSLGQNFLKSKGALRAIVSAGKLSANDVVLEIGPGRGALTEALLGTGATVVAVEKDDALVPFLQQKFEIDIKEKKLFIIHGDILKLSASDIFTSTLPPFSSSPLHYKLIANIPYYITGEVIRKFLEEASQPSLMVLLVQKEVAERITVKDGKESILSMAVRAYSTPRLVAKVPRGAFVPAPNVDSAVVAFERISKKTFTENDVSEAAFFELVKAGFAHKRKKLGGNLKALKDKLDIEVFEKFKDRRAEELRLADWISLFPKTSN